MATSPDRSGFQYPTRLSSEALAAVKDLRVSAINPETSTNDSLDFERCSALHNAIVTHAWQAQGYYLADLPTTTWWQRPDYASRLHDLQQHLPESLVEFLKRALNPSAEELPDASRYYFFYLSDGLANPDSLWSEVGQSEGEMGGIERIALYLTDTYTSDETLDAIVYDCDSHWCVFNSSAYFIFEDKDSSPIWQRLETILTAWIEMIERRKVAVVHKDLGSGPDPASGVFLDMKEPWGWASWSKTDLEDALNAWNDLVYAINDRLPEPQVEALSDTSLFEVDDLKAAGIEEGSFAWEFYSKARRPYFKFLGPGLQLASREELLSNPFRTAWETQNPQENFGRPEVFPMPILLGSQFARSWVESHQYTVGPVTWGLYFDMLHTRTLSCPYEDATRLVLPYELKDDTAARRLDGQPALGNAELFQIGQNPFETAQATTQLWQMLKNFTAHIDSEEWKVDADGVNERATVFDNFFMHGIDPDGDEAENVRYSILKNMYL